MLRHIPFSPPVSRSTVALFAEFTKIAFRVLNGFLFLVDFVTDKEVALGHHPSNKLTAKNGDKAPLVSWEPYFCVLLQDEQTFTACYSEEMAVSYS